MKYFDREFWQMTTAFLLILIVGLVGIYYLDWLKQLG